MLKKAAEIEEVEGRLRLISDMNAAFFGGGDHVKRLQNLYRSLSGNLLIHWEEEPRLERKIIEICEVK